MPRYVSRVPLDEAWAGLVDDAAIFPPGDAPLHEATASLRRPLGRRRRRAGRHLRAQGHRPAAACAASAARCRWSHRRRRSAGGSLRWALTPSTCLDLAGMEIARARPRRPGRQRAPGGAQRPTTSRREWPIFVELPQTVPDHGWLAAADGRCRAGLRLKFRTGGLEAEAFPASERRSRAGSMRRWTGRRRSSAPPACTGPCGTPARTASSTTGSSTCWSRPAARSTAPRVDEVVAVLEDRACSHPRRDDADLAGARWFSVVRLLLGRRAVGRPARAGAGR